MVGVVSPAVSTVAPRFSARGRIYRPGTVEEEFRQAFANVRNIARAAGFSLAEFVSVHVALAEIDDYEIVNRAYRHAFAGEPNLPARLTYQAGALPFGCKVEVQAIAAHS
jgi:2-iminobutanoate/2-iminopropanoate deaminase